MVELHDRLRYKGSHTKLSINRVCLASSQLFRLHVIAPAIEGHGLGLCSCQEVIALLALNITVYRVLNFSVYKFILAATLQWFTAGGAIRNALRQLSQTWKLRHYDVIDDAITRKL